MADDQQEKVGSKEAAKPKRFSLKWIIIAATLVVVLGIGGVVGWNLVIKKDNKHVEKKQKAAESPSEKKKNEAKILYPLEHFIVNLMDKDGLGKRYLKVTIELEVNDEASKNLIEFHKAELKDTILLLLSGLSFEEINSIEGKLELKQALLSRVNQVLGGSIIQRIYFTEFVVQ